MERAMKACPKLPAGQETMDPVGARAWNRASSSHVVIWTNNSLLCHLAGLGFLPWASVRGSQTERSPGKTSMRRRVHPVGRVGVTSWVVALLMFIGRAAQA